MLSAWNRIAERLPLPNIVDFLLQGECIERRERKTEKQADASVEHSESLTKSMLDLFWRSLDGGGVGDAPMRRHGLTRPLDQFPVPVSKQKCVHAPSEIYRERGRSYRLDHD